MAKSSDVKSIFGEALELTPAQRAAYIEQACADDSALRDEVERLLEALDKAGHFMSRPAVAPLDTAVPELGAEAIGTVIGPYKLLEKLGEGGMGLVFVAEQQQPVRRKVAVKVIKPGMNTREVIARFEAERQALALMDHPHIAHVLDAGTTPSGLPYFVMELVRGVPITEFCDANRLTLRERLELFVDVCNAVQHAHQKGIIHRDLKASNILITLHDGTPAVKVIDFGVAKAVGQQLTEKTIHTRFSQMMGTPLYMSPEQAEMSGLDIDTRSDIYSLGVLLYELLTGRTPFDREQMRTATFDEIRRIVREEEPALPSKRMSTLGQAATTAAGVASGHDSGDAGAPSDLTTIASQRKSDPRRLSHLFRRELDWIVMKSLEKDRKRRYETASAFAADVLRYLHDEPVQACPPSVGYRLRKFVLRNRGPVLAATLVVLVLVSGIIGTTWGMIRAEQARQDAVSAQFAEAERAEGERRAKDEAQKRLAQIEKGTETLASVIRDLDPMAAEKEGVTLRALMGQRLGEAAEQLEGDAMGDPLVVARLQHVLGISLRELGHLKQAEVVLVKAGQTRERLLGADDLDTVATKHHLALLYRDQGKYAPAEALYQEVLAIRTAKLGANHPDTLTSQHHLAWLYHNQGKYALAEASYKEVVAVGTAELGADHPETLTSQHRLASLYRAQGKDALAEALYQEVLAIRTAKLGADHLDTVATKQNLAALYRAQEKYSLAETLYQEVLSVRTAKLGADHPDTLTSRHHLAQLYHSQGKSAVAEALYHEVLAARIAKLGADHPVTLRSQYCLAGLYRDQGKFALAEALYRDVLAVRAAKLGADHPDTLYSRYSLAMLYRSMKKLEQSIPLLEETVKLRKGRSDLDCPPTLGMQADLGVLYCDAGRFADAIPLLEEVRRKDPDLVGDALLTAYVRTSKTAEATALVTEQVQAARQQFPADSPQLAAALAAAGQSLLDAKAYADAEPLLLQSVEGLKASQADGGHKHFAQATSARLIETVEHLIAHYQASGMTDEVAKWKQELKVLRTGNQPEQK